MYISQQLISIFVGVLSGIITAGLLWILTLLFKKVLLPWFEQFVYRGVNVGGNWIYTDKGPEAVFELRLQIEQKAHQINGTFQAKTNWLKKEQEYVNFYRLKGFVKDNYILFTYTALRKDRTGIGSFLLRVSHGGTQLIGSAIYTPDGSRDDTTIVSREDIVFERN